jgi:hypothetical protein
MSLSRAVYSDGVVPESRYSSANPRQEPPEAAPSHEETGGNVCAVHLSFEQDRRNENSDGWC